MDSTPPLQSPRKLSEAFLAFAQPVLQFMPEKPTPRDVERACGIAQLVWNSVVLEKRGRPSEYLSIARRAIRDEMDELATEAMLGLIDILEQQKRDEAPEDLRLIGSLDAFVDDEGELRIRATAVGLPPRN